MTIAYECGEKRKSQEGQMSGLASLVAGGAPYWDTEVQLCGSGSIHVSFRPYDTGLELSSEQLGLWYPISVGFLGS
jgi:hypothetical protein